MCTVPPLASQIFGFGVRRQNGRPRTPEAAREGCKGWDDASSHSLDWLRWPWPSPKRSKLVHTARRSQILKFRQIWARSRASADPNAPHDPDSDPKGYSGTDHTQGIPEQPEITRDSTISQNGRVHKVFGHMGGRTPTNTGQCTDMDRGGVNTRTGRYEHETGGGRTRGRHWARREDSTPKQ